MNANDPQLELLTAYLDGEVSAEERLRCEQLLRSSESHRRMFEELQAVSERVQQLPSFQLETDFADRVLEAAQQQQVEPQYATMPTLATPPSGRGDARRAGRKSRTWLVGLSVVAAIVTLICAAWLVPNGDRPVADPGEPPEAVTDPELDSDPGRTVPEPQSAVASSSTPAPTHPDRQPGEARQMVAEQGDPDAPLRFMLVVDVELTQAGIDARTFDEALRQSGVPIGPVIRMDSELEQALITSRFGKSSTKDSESDRAKKKPAREPYAELIYVRGRGPGFDAMIMHLMQAKTEVASVRLDLAQGPDVELFQQLNRATGEWTLADAGPSRHQAEGEFDPDSAPSESPERARFSGLARRIALNSAVRNRLAQPFMIAALPAAAMLNSLTHVPTPPATDDLDDFPEPDSAEQREKMQQLLDLEFQVLFVVRNKER